MKKEIFKLSLIFFLLLLQNFKVFSQIKSILDFDTLVGYHPNSLYSDGKDIYAITMYGGDSLKGTFFKLSADGLSFKLIKSFDSYAPHPLSMIGKDGIIYISTMMTKKGDGMIYQYNIGLDKLDSLLEFPRGTINGTNLIFINDSLIWGVSSHSTNDRGSIITVKLDGSSFRKVYKFTQSDYINGTAPSFCAIDDSSIYISCAGGGAFPYPNPSGDSTSSGCIVKVNINTLNYQKLFDCQDSIGTHPNSLIIYQNKIYGIFISAGNDRNAKLFCIDNDGLNFRILARLNTWGRGKLLMIKNSLFGITSANIFSYNIENEEYSELINFSKSMGRDGNVNVLLNDSIMAVATQQGGKNNYGALLIYLIPKELGIPNHSANFLNDLRIVPNPTFDFIDIYDIKISSENIIFDLELNIYNLIGEIILTTKIQNVEHQRIDISGLSKGIYFLKIYNTYMRFVKL